MQTQSGCIAFWYFMFVIQMLQINNGNRATNHQSVFVILTARAVTGSEGAFHTADMSSLLPLKNSIGRSRTSNTSSASPAVGSSGSTPSGTALESTKDSRPWAYMLNYKQRTNKSSVE